MKLWLDDVRPAPEGWVWARKLSEAKEYLAEGTVTECSLDHDLGFHDIEIPDDPDELIEVMQLRGQSAETGYDLVNWMIEHECVPAKITIHSWNGDGARYMAARLNYYGHNCTIAPFKDPRFTKTPGS